MTRQKQEQLSSLLNEYYDEMSKVCDYDCYNCELGVLEGYSSGHSCSIEIIMRKIDEDLYENKNF